MTGGALARSARSASRLSTIRLPDRDREKHGDDPGNRDNAQRIVQCVVHGAQCADPSNKDSAARKAVWTPPVQTHAGLRPFNACVFSLRTKT